MRARGGEEERQNLVIVGGGERGKLRGGETDGNQGATWKMI